MTPNRVPALAAVVLALSILVGLAIGPAAISVAGIGQALLAKLPLLGIHSPLNATQEAIVFQLRAPRVALAAVVGGMLALAGASYQGVFRNPLADPYLLGVAGGAGLGATTIIASGASPTSVLLPGAAFVGAISAVGVAYLLARSAYEGTRSPASLILAGVTVAAFATAAQTFIQQRKAETLQAVYSWILGHLDAASWGDVLLVLPYVTLAAVVLVVHRRILDVLTLGDEEAGNLGIHVARVRATVVLAATLGTAAAVAVSGLIGFVGIIVPHAIRLASGARYRTLLPASLLIGGAFLVLADTAARTVLAPSEVPVGIVTAFVGAPFFAVVLRSAKTVV